MRVPALFLLTGLMVSTIAPAWGQTARDQKDECLVASQNCKAQVDDIQKRINKLNREIRKGTKVYTPEELKALQEKLNETDQLLRKMEESGGS